MHSLCSKLNKLESKVKSGMFDSSLNKGDEDDSIILVDEGPDTPELSREISVKIRSRSGIQRFTMKKVCTTGTAFFNEVCHLMYAI